MATPLPSQFELKCAGISLIIVSILWVVAFWLQQIDHDLYDIATNESVVKLHEKVSSPQHRLKIEISCALLWISFPFCLAAIHGIRKMMHVPSQGTPAELLMYIAEKAYILMIGLCLVLVPSLSLTSVSFDWNYETDTVNSYWIQLYLIIYKIEVIDCLAICDATFMLSLFFAGTYFVYLMKTKKKKSRKYANLDENLRGYSRYYRNCFDFMTILMGFICCSMTVIFIMILFQFAESGFFSITGNINASILFLWSHFIKILLGLRYIARARNYQRLRKMYGLKSDEDGDNAEDNLNPGDIDDGGYKMTPITIEEDLEKGGADTTNE